MDPEKTIAYLKETRLFGNIPQQYLSLIAEMSEVIELDPDSVILQEGEDNDSLYLLMEGSLAINLSGEPIIKLYRRGDLVGEMSLINSKPCAATVAADSESVILKLDGQKIHNQKIMEDDVSTGVFYRVFSTILADKLVLTTAKARDFEIANRELRENREKLQKAYEESLQEIAKRISIEQELKRHQDHLEEMVNERTAKALEAQAAAESANQLKSDFLSSVSHELRTPLQAVLSFSNMGISKMEELDRDKIVYYFENISTAGHRLLSLLNDLLDLAKLEAGKMDFNKIQTGLSNLIGDVLEEFGALSEQGKIQFDFQKPDAEQKLNADPVKIMQVIRNLLSNAIKFSKPHDTITIRINNRDDFVSVSIADRGVGIPPDELSSIFEKFSQSRRTIDGISGTGLGLAICKEIITAHQGDIWAENNSEVGATFYFKLPLSCD